MGRRRLVSSLVVLLLALLVPASASAARTPRDVSDASVTLSAPEALATAGTYTVKFTTGAAIAPGGSITLTAAPGTLFPQGGCDYAGTDSTTPSASFGPGAADCATTRLARPGLPVFGFEAYSGSSVSLTVPNAIPAGDSLTLVVSDVTNPGPGSDTLAIDTNADPQPVSVPYTIVPAAAVSAPTVTLSSHAAGATAVTDTATFTLGGHGALSADGAIQTYSTITLQAGPGTDWGQDNCDYSLTDATNPSADFTCAAGLSFGLPGDPVQYSSIEGSLVTIAVPTTIPAGDTVTLTATGTGNGIAGTSRFTVRTSSDPAPASTPSVTIGSATAITGTAVSLAPTTAGAVGAAYTVPFVATTAIPAGGTIRLSGPAGLRWSDATDCDYALTDTTNPGANFTCSPGTSFANIGTLGAAATIEVSSAIAAGDHLVLHVLGAVNPPTGSHTLTVSTSADPTPVSTAFTTTAPGSVTDATLARSSTAARAADVQTTIGFTASAAGAMPLGNGGGGTITLTAPLGVTWPTNACAYEVIDVTTSTPDDGCPTLESVNPDTVTLQLTDPVAASDRVSVQINGMTNPAAGSDHLTVATSGDPVPVSLAETTTAAQAVTPGALSLSSAVAGATGVTYTVGLTTSTTGALPFDTFDSNDGAVITVHAAPGTVLPAGGCAYAVTDDTTPSGTSDCAEFAQLADNGAEATVGVAASVNAGDQLSLAISGVTNPGGGTQTLTVTTSADALPATSTTTITGSPVALGSVGSPTLTASSTSAAADGATDTFAFTATDGVPSGGTITLDAPRGTVFAPCPLTCGPNAGNDNYVLTDLTTPSGDGDLSPTVSNDGATVTLRPAAAIAAGDSLQLAVDEVENPATVGASPIAVSTSADPVPVSATESITAASTVTGVSVTRSTSAAIASGVTDTVDLTTSAEGELIANQGAIVLTGSPGTFVGPCFGCNTGASYTIDDLTSDENNIPANPSTDADGTELALTPSQTIAAGDTLAVSVTGAINPLAGAGTVLVSTTSDRTPVSVAQTTVAAAAVSAATLTRTTSVAGADSVSYDVRFTASAHGGLQGNGDGAISLLAPAGTEFAPCFDACGGSDPDVTIDDLTSGDSTTIYGVPQVAANGSEVTFYLRDAIAAGDTVEVTVTNVDNPPVGAGTITLTTSSDITPVTLADATVAPGSVSNVTFSPSTTAADASGVTYTVGLTASASGGLARLGAIDLKAPAGTVFGTCPYGCGGGNATYTIDDLTTGVTDAGASPVVSDEGDTVAVIPSKPIAGGDRLRLTITQVTNPPQETGALAVSTSSDLTPVTVPDLTSAPTTPSDVTLAADATNLTDTIGFTASAQGELLGGVGSVTLIAPPGTGFPNAASDGDEFTITDHTHASGDGTESTMSVLDGGAEAVLDVPSTIEAGDVVTVTVPDVEIPASGVGLSLVTSSDTVPAAASVPSAVTASAGDASATVAWTAPADVTGITDYLVTPYVGATASTPDEVPATSTTVVVPGLTNGTSYTFTVTAVTADGDGPPSAHSGAVTPSASAGGGGGGGSGGGGSGGEGTPTLTFGTQVLDFGTVGTGLQSTASVTAYNTGTGPLAISTVTVGGADSGDFTITSDPCAGASIAAGSSCTVSLSFAPAGVGARTATLSLTDDASGSPQSVALTGTGTDQASLQGQIVDGSAAAKPGVSGALISLCTEVSATSGRVCQSGITNDSGRYAFADLSPGPYLIQVSSPSAALFGASATFTLTAGANTEDLSLTAPQTLGAGVSIDGQSGIPTLFWDAPATMTYDPDFPAEPAGTEIAYITTVSLSNLGASTTETITSGSLVMLVDYGAGGKPTVTAQYPDPQSGPDPEVDLGGVPTAAELSRLTRRPPNARAADAGVGNVLVQYDPASGGFNADIPSVNQRTHGATSFDIERSYVITATPDDAGSDVAHAAKASCKVPSLVGTPASSAGSALTKAGCALGAITTAANARPAGRIFAVSPPAGKVLKAGAKVNLSVSTGPTPKCVVPNVVGLTVAQAQTALAKAHCSVGKITQVTSSKQPAGHVVSSNPPAGRAVKLGFPVALRVSLGAAKTKVKIKRRRIILKYKPPKPGPRCCRIKFPPDGGDGYYDPSGTVSTTTGIPVAGATVTLESSASTAGPFAAVPNGSVVMSPSNRVNPDHTDSVGHFGWDVAPGFYRVSAQHSGCNDTATTSVYAVPPPVDNLLLKLVCPHLKRAKARMALRSRLVKGFAVVTATVHGRAPGGAITFTAGSLTATIPLGAHTHAASFIAAPGQKVTARYGGDGRNKPAKRSAHVA